jgi:hypothetical protein
MLRVAAGIALASTFASAALGQQGKNPEQPSGGRGVGADRVDRDRAMRERLEMERNLREREFMLRMLENEARRPQRRPEPQLAYAQLKDDFMRLQVVNNDLAQAVSSGSALDFKFVARSASEIKKRASRLKLNLALPEPEKDAKRPRTEVPAEPEHLKTSLSTLDDLILSFVHNPVFQSVNVIDAQMSMKARRDLEAIIDLSDKIKKSSERLSKSADKSQ